jgi:hypothetical protein
VPGATARFLLKTSTLARFPGVRNPWTFGQNISSTELHIENIEKDFEIMYDLHLMSGASGHE